MDGSDVMQLYNDTLLGSVLASIQSNVRKRAGLHHAIRSHPDYEPERADRHDDAIQAIQQEWEVLRRDLGVVYQLPLVEFHELTLPLPDGSVRRPAYVQKGYDLDGTHNPLRKSLGVVKRDMDKARRKDSKIKMMKSWDLEARRRPAKEQ